MQQILKRRASDRSRIEGRWAGNRMLPLTLSATVALVLGCGVNEVVIEISGGDGNEIRLDADQVEYKFNQLVKAGTYTFKEVKRGDYAVHVVGRGYMKGESLKVESAPLTGVATHRVRFDLPDGANSKPALTGTILFASSPVKVRDWDLFTVKADGTGLTQLTDDDENEQHPSWSPDGTKILFTRGSVLTNLDIYVMDADGGNVTRLTEHPERDQRARWSPDGTQVTYVSQRDGDVAVWIMDADGSGKHKLVNGREPSWSPDGKRIAFTGHGEAATRGPRLSPPYEEGDDDDEIYVIDVDGTNLRRITNQKRYDWFANWDPSGARLAFNSHRVGGQELVVADVETGMQARITIAEHTFEQEAQWSPDGNALVYRGKMKFRDDGELDVTLNIRTGKYHMEGTFDIFIVDAVGFDWDDSDERPIMPVNLTNTTDRDEASPSWRAY